MSGAKETPRQKMIGMMYLVYTALLAMNVSKDILGAFDTVNTGVQETNITLMQQIAQKYTSFEEQYGLDQEKVGPYWEQAQALRSKTDEIINYIEAMKWDLVSRVEEMDYNQAIEHGLLKNADTLQYNGRRLYNINTSKDVSPSYQYDNAVHNITCGVGYRYKSIYTDLAYVHKMRESVYNAFSPINDEFGYDPNVSADVKDNNNRISLTLGVRF